MAEPIVGCIWYSSDPDVYWFGISVDEGGSYRAVELSPTSVVLIERQIGGGWSSDLQLEVAQEPELPGRYLIRTIIPPALANGQERILRLTIDGIVYGPWSFRFAGPV